MMRGTHWLFAAGVTLACFGCTGQQAPDSAQTAATPADSADVAGALVNLKVPNMT